MHVCGTCNCKLIFPILHSSLFIANQKELSPLVNTQKSVGGLALQKSSSDGTPTKDTNGNDYDMW